MSGFREYGASAQQILDESIDTSSAGSITPESIGADTPEDRDAAIAEVVGAAPGQLDTLNELAAALGDDQNYAATITSALAGKQPLDATLTAFAALAIATGKLPYGSGDDAFSLADLTAAGRALLDDADAAAQLTTLGLSTFIKTLVDDADAATARATLGVDKVAVPFVIDGGGSAITTGIKGDVPPLGFAWTITGWDLLLDQSGSIVIDIWKDTYANYPPVVGDTITASDKPTVSSATKAQDLAPTGWTVAVAADESLRINVDSITTTQRASLMIYGVRA